MVLFLTGLNTHADARRHHVVTSNNLLPSTCLMKIETTSFPSTNSEDVINDGINNDINDDNDALRTSVTNHDDRKDCDNRRQYIDTEDSGFVVTNELQTIPTIVQQVLVWFPAPISNSLDCTFRAEPIESAFIINNNNGNNGNNNGSEGNSSGVAKSNMVFARSSFGRRTCGNRIIHRNRNSKRQDRNVVG